MSNSVEWNNWIIPHFSSICDEVCSESFHIQNYKIKLSSKNFKYLFFPFNINIKLTFNSPTKKRKKIRTKLTFIICNVIKSRNIFIQEEVVFENPNYEYLLKTKLTQEKLCDRQRGWVNSDSIKIKFAIEFIDSYDNYYEFDRIYDEESTSDEIMSDSDDSEPGNERDETFDKNYFDFQIYNLDGEDSGTLKFRDFELNLSSSIIPNQFFTVIFSFWTNRKVNIIFTFKLINFIYQQPVFPMEKISIRNRNQEPYEKRVNINFPITYENIIDDEGGWLKNRKYMVLHINFYYPNSREEMFQLPGSKKNYNIHYSRNYSFDYDRNINNYNNRISYSSNSNSAPYRSVYHDTSKEDTGCVGLQNQGATCYMNSLLQSLFHIPAFRKIVYNMQLNGQEDLKTSIPLCLQRLFAKLQFNNESCSTKELTTSFGWTNHETFVQHDVQEFCTVLISKLSDKMKGTSLENSLSNLLGGKFKSYIRCVDVDFESSKTEEFFDLSMNVKGVQNLEQSFKTYVEPEQLNGDNQYKTDEYGPQDAIMGTEFIEFPPVLHIHLRRFQFDYQTMRMAKINDRFEFPLTINLKPYTINENREEALNSNENEYDHQNQYQNENEHQSENQNQDQNENDNQNQNDFVDESRNQNDTDVDDNDFIYDLYGVLVHSGSIAGGHYFAFLRTSTSPQWFKFNDSCVSKATKNEAVDDNFGGSSASSYSEKSYSAYMLIYIKRNEANEIMAPINEEEVPSYLVKYAKGASNDTDNSNTYDNNNSINNKNGDLFNEEEKTIEIKFYDEFGILINSILGNPDYSNEKVKKTLTLNAVIKQQEEDGNEKSTPLNHHIVYNKIAKFLDIDPKSFRLWLFMSFPYVVFQDDLTLVPNDLTMFLQSKEIETACDISSSSSQGARNIIFIKFYHPSLQFPINYIESVEIPKEEPIETLFEKVRNIIGLKEDEELLVFQQFPNYYKQIEPDSKSLLSCQTLIFQLKPGQLLPTDLSYNFLKLDDIVKNNYIEYFDDKSKKQFEQEYNVIIIKKSSKSTDGVDCVEIELSNGLCPLYKYIDVMDLSLLQNVQDYSNYRKNAIYLNVFEFDNLFASIPAFRISFDSSISLSELKSFIARIYRSSRGINLGYNDSDYASVLNSIQIYKSVNKSPKSREPSDKPIIKQQGYSNLAFDFKKADECQNIFVLYNIGVPELIAENDIISIIALISGNGFNRDEFKIFHISGNNKDGINIGCSCIQMLEMMIGDERIEDQVITIQNANLSGNYENENNGYEDEGFVDDYGNQNSLCIMSNKDSAFKENESGKPETSIDETDVNNGESSLNENEPHYTELACTVNAPNENGSNQEIISNNSSSLNNDGDVPNNEDSSSFEIHFENVDETKQEIIFSNENISNNAEISHQISMPTEVAGIPINCIRISQIKGHIIRKVLSLDFQVKVNSIIRFDIISEEERDLLDNGAVQVPVSHISEDDMLTFGDPFFITVVEDEKFENVKKRLNDYLVGNDMMTNQEFMRLSFYFGDADQPGSQKKVLWKDMNVLKEMRSKVSYSGQNIVLFILHKTKKNVDMSVKIYN